MDAAAIDGSHRPWPAPGRPWAMLQTWRDLLFAHWALPAEHLEPLVPKPLALDTRDGLAWLGVVPFRMTGIRLRGLPPLPGASAFPELNVRTYVTLEGRPGVQFLSLDATNRLAVEVARRRFRLPYVGARIACRRRGDEVTYAAERRDHRLPRPAELRVRYGPTGPPTREPPGSLAHWLTERYCLYAVEGGRVWRGEIDHAPWPLRPARAVFEANTMAAAAGITLADDPPLLHFADDLAVRLWGLELVQRAD